MKLKLLMLILLLSISSSVFSLGSSIFILYDFSSSYHQPDNQEQVKHNDKAVFTKFDNFIREATKPLNNPISIRVIPIRELGLKGTHLYEFCINKSAFQRKSSPCVKPKTPDGKAKVRVMAEKIKKYRSFNATDISGALYQTSLYINSEEEKDDNLIIIFSDMAEFRMKDVVDSNYDLSGTRILIVYKVTKDAGENTQAEEDRIDEWVVTLKSKGAIKVKKAWEDTKWYQSIEALFY